MAFLLKTDLTTIIYLEDINVITEGDDTKVTSAINAGIGEAYSYLDRFDIPTLFVDAPVAPAADTRDPILMESCKALAVWFLVKACPANQDVKEIEKGAEAARTWLRRVQKGELKPYGWPLKPTLDQNTFFHVASYNKRVNNF